MFCIHTNINPGCGRNCRGVQCRLQPGRMGAVGWLGLVVRWRSWWWDQVLVVRYVIGIRCVDWANCLEYDFPRRGTALAVIRLTGVRTEGGYGHFVEEQGEVTTLLQVGRHERQHALASPPSYGGHRVAERVALQHSRSAKAHNNALAVVSQHLRRTILST